MKILQIIQKPQKRGAETFACQLSSNLVALGHEVKIVAVFEGQAELPFKGQISNLKASAGNRFLDFSAWKRLAREIEEFKPAVVQVNAGDTLKYAVFSKVLFGWKQPVVSRNASEVGAYIRSSLQKEINKFFYRRIDGIISVSKASESNIIENFPFLKGRTEVIPIGLEGKPIEDMTLEPLDAKHIVHVGGFSFEKNHKGLLRIFQNVLEKLPEVHLHLVGDGPLREEVENEISRLGLTEKVTLYGFVNNPMSYIQAADVLVLPSIIEGLPGVLLEAMYCKTPVIAYDVGGISEIVSPGTGVLVEKQNEQRFTEAIIEIFEKPHEGRVRSAFAMVSEKYMNDKIALRFSESYRKVAAGS